MKVHFSHCEYLVVSLSIQFECGKIRTRKTPNIDTFYAMENYHAKQENQCQNKPILTEYSIFIPLENAGKPKAF